jgi:hypothetical protein
MGAFDSKKTKLCKNLIITLVFEKNAKFFAENCRKSPKIAIITSTADKFVKNCHEFAQNVAQSFFVYICQLMRKLNR